MYVWQFAFTASSSSLSYTYWHRYSLHVLVLSITTHIYTERVKEAYKRRRGYVRHVTNAIPEYFCLKCSYIERRRETDRCLCMFDVWQLLRMDKSKQNSLCCCCCYCCYFVIHVSLELKWLRKELKLWKNISKTKNLHWFDIFCVENQRRTISADKKMTIRNA